MNYQLVKSTSSISGGLSGMVSFDLKSQGNTYYDLSKAYLLAKFKITLGDVGGLGVLQNGNDRNDTFVGLCSNFGACLFDSVRVSVNQMMLQSHDNYAISSTMQRLVSVDKDQNETSAGSALFFNDSHVITGDGAVCEKAGLPFESFKYSAINRLIYEATRNIFTDPFERREITFEVPIALDCVLFNTAGNLLPPNSQLRLDLVINSIYHYAIIQYTRSGLIVDNQTLTVNKSDAQAIANHCNVICNDLSLYVPVSVGNGIMNDSVLLKAMQLHTHTKTVQSTNESFTVSLPSKADMVVVSFADNRRGQQNKPYGYFGWSYQVPEVIPAVPNAPDVFTLNGHNLIRSVEIQAGNTSYPSSRYNINVSKFANDLSEARRAYGDFVRLSGCKLMSFNQWRMNPMFCVLLQEPAESLLCGVQFHSTPANLQANVTTFSSAEVKIDFDRDGQVSATSLLE